MLRGMELGITMFATDYALRPDELAHECEARGFESLWLPEHTHIPASRRTPYPAGGELPKEYWHTHDPFVALMAAAGVTRRLKLATGICLLVERDPIVTAKEVASLDRLSDGRFLFGIGGGWNAEEMENHGVAFDSRWELLREKVEAMKRIWTEDEPRYTGSRVRFEPIWSWPKPAQQPHPPILLGGNAPGARRRVVDYADGWMPIAPLVPDLEDAVGDLRQRAEAAGRDPASISLSLFWAVPEAAELDRYRRLGAERAILQVPPAGRDEVLPLLDRYAALAR
jgi:probable F420-dependent oxidoreductase